MKPGTEGTTTSASEISTSEANRLEKDNDDEIPRSNIEDEETNKTYGWSWTTNGVQISSEDLRVGQGINQITNSDQNFIY